ncbi:MAG: CGNR zinc finger domain-containing protein [Methylibium sp.]|uniref:CGNR zinc finger domain-containing protein n=1 Tax=Methylibium sp. TaxID=2067992 RepID=UPI001856053B|nr:ABATE domain-containing protein [Methylibium sp.]MBA3595988.1 CGNR zinc finger domain-containing protein [Methylibium sp.]
MSPLFLAGHPALDFLNTALAPQGRPIELIGNGGLLVDWLRGAKLLSEQETLDVKRRFGVKALDSAAREARVVREWARAWLARWRMASAEDKAEDLRFLNRLLAYEMRTRQVVVVDEGLRLVERARLETPEAVLALIASQIAALVTTEDPSLIKDCAGHGCTLWFLDRTKAHRRLFCSAAACGNRAKVAAFRGRQRAAG